MQIGGREVGDLLLSLLLGGIALMASHFVKLEFVYMTSLFRSFVLFLFGPKKKKGNSKRMILVDDLLLVLEIAEADAEYVVRKV